MPDTEPRGLRGVAGELEQFNARVPVGSPVVYWPGVREGAGTESVTRTRAWLLGDHTPVVMVEGYAGGIALTHVMPLPAAAEPQPEPTPEPSDWHDPEQRAAAGMGRDHDRMILERAEEGIDGRVVVVRCPHTVGLTIDAGEYLAFLPCPCNDRSEIVAVVEPVEDAKGCECTELCDMGPTCPGGMLARLPGSGCWRTAPEVVQDDGEALAGIMVILAEHWNAGMSPNGAPGSWECACGQPIEVSDEAHHAHIARRLREFLRADRAQRDAEVAATARREGAQAVIDAVEDACCADPSWLTDGEESRVAAFAVVRAAHDAAARLRERCES